MAAVISKLFVLDFVGTAKVGFYSWLSRLHSENPMQHRDPNNPWYYLEEREYQLMCALFVGTEGAFTHNRRVVFEPEDRHVEVHIEAVIPEASLLYEHFKQDFGKILITQYKDFALKPIAWVVDSNLWSVDVVFNRTNIFADFKQPIPRDWVLPWTLPGYVLEVYKDCQAISNGGIEGEIPPEAIMRFLADVHQHTTQEVAAITMPTVPFDWRGFCKLGEPFLLAALPILKLNWHKTRVSEIVEPFIDAEIVDAWVSSMRINRKAKAVSIKLDEEEDDPESAVSVVRKQLGR